MEAAAISRVRDLKDKVSLIIAVRKKPPGKQGINLTGLQSDPWK
jgi:hypothetical protein